MEKPILKNTKTEAGNNKSCGEMLGDFEGLENFPGITFHFSKSSEVERIKSTFKRITWYKENKYKINLPQGLEKFLDTGVVPSVQEILEAVEREFDESVYKNVLLEIQSEWKKRVGEFFVAMNNMGLKVSREYKILLSRYGVGGSYKLPDTICVNFNYERPLPLGLVIFHEAVHLAIEERIRENNIVHWDKEIIVDLICATIYNDYRQLQKRGDMNRVNRIKKVFQESFPDIEAVIKKLGKL